MDNLQKQKMGISQDMMQRRVCSTCGQPIGADNPIRKLLMPDKSFLPILRPGDWDRIRPMPGKQPIRRFPEQPGGEKNRWGDLIGTKYLQWEGPGNPAWEARQGQRLFSDGTKGYGESIIGRQSGHERVNTPKLRQIPINTKLTDAFNNPKTKITGGNPAFARSFNDSSVKISNTPYRQNTPLKTLKRDSLSQVLGRVKMKNQYK